MNELTPWLRAMDEVVNRMGRNKEENRVKKQKGRLINNNGENSIVISTQNETVVFKWERGESTTIDGKIYRYGMAVKIK